MNGQHLLTINTGSSSLKAALFRVGERETRLLAAQAERIGLPGSRLRLEGSASRTRPSYATGPGPHELADRDLDDGS